MRPTSGGQASSNGAATRSCSCSTNPGTSRVRRVRRVGIATGTVEFFAAGSVHRELLVAGPVATETVTIEAGADAGEIGISQSLARTLDPLCVGTKEHGLLLVAPPEAERGRAPDVGPVRGSDVAWCIPIAARGHVLLEHSEPEHRTITATFIELMDTDVWLARLGPLAFADALDERIRAIQETAVHYEVPFNVADVSKGSVKVLLTAGAPSSTGHDEEQTLRMAREIMEQPGVIPIRIGVNAGRVFTGDFGPPYRRTYAVLGDAINTAARVMSRADAGQILATDAVLERSRTMFATTPIEPFEAKGKAEPVRASIVGPIVGKRDQDAAETPFVGRAAELAALVGVLAEVKAGNGWTVEIAGPSGIGKSRLVRELLAATPDLRVLRAECEQYEASTPYYALREPARQVLGLAAGSPAAEAERRLRDVVAAVDPDLVAWLPLLGILLGLDLAPTPETSALDQRFLREALADVALRFLVATLDAAATVLVVEDAHFMDEASADLLRRISQAAVSLPHALFVTQSDTASSWTRLDEEGVRYLAFALLPLSEREAAEIVEIATDNEPLRPHEVEELARRSGGSPLFLVELLDLARSSGSTAALPDSVEAVVTAEIDRLSLSDRAVLRYASVLGVTFARELLEVALREEVLVDGALWERLRGLVDPDPAGNVHFRNTLVRDVAYEGLPFRRRRELHARVAEAIEMTAASIEDEAATLALHYAAANRRGKTWHYARLAGDRARAVAANVEAARLYELALSAGGFVRTVSGKERAEVLVALGTVRETAGLFDESFEALRRATSLLPDDPIEQARIFARRTRARVRTGSYVLALRETTKGLRLVEGREETAAVAARATLLAMRSEIRMLQGRAREAIPLALTAVDEAQRAEELEALAHAYTALDGSYQMLGQPEKAVHERMALEIYRSLGNARLSGIYGLNVGVQAYADGRWDEATELYVQARADCLRAGDRPHAAHLGSSLAELLIGKSELDEAERLLTDSRRVLRASTFRALALFAEIQLARCALERGDAAGAVGSLETVAAEAATVGYAAIVLEAGVYLAHAHARAGSPAAGLAALDAAVAAASDEASLYAAAVERARAACLVALDRDEEARELLDRALAAAERQGLLYEQLLARQARFELGDPGAEADEELREIDRLAQLLGVR